MAAAGRLTVLPSDRRLTGLNFGVQRWPVTLSEIVTEVTDEVVDGRLLGLCARAHLAAARGLLAWLSPDRAAVRFHSLEEALKKEESFTNLIRQWIGYVP